MSYHLNFVISIKTHVNLHNHVHFLKEQVNDVIVSLHHQLIESI